MEVFVCDRLATAPGGPRQGDGQPRSLVRVAPNRLLTACGQRTAGGHLPSFYVAGLRYGYFANRALVVAVAKRPPTSLHQADSPHPGTIESSIPSARSARAFATYARGLSIFLGSGPIAHY